MTETVAVVTTCDTKGAEALYIKELIEAYTAGCLVIDCGILSGPVDVVPDISQHEVAAAVDTTVKEVIALGSRGAAVDKMRHGAAVIIERLYQEKKIHALLVIGGAEGSSIARTAMDALPMGVPKLTVSTIASGRHYFSDIIGYNDAMVMHSVVDILGINSISKQVFDHAVGAVIGMLRCVRKEHALDSDRIAISMLGTTTPPVMNVIKPRLEDLGYEVLTFHANGVGGACMDKLIREGFFKAVIDFTPNELAGHLYGGLHNPGMERMEAAIDMKLPMVVAPGALNLIALNKHEAEMNQYDDRSKYYHNPEITLIRLKKNEMVRLAQVLAEKLNRSQSPARFVYPAQGFSQQGMDGRPMHDADANHAFLETIKGCMRKDIPIIELDAHINSDAFANAVTDELLRILE